MKKFLSIMTGLLIVASAGVVFAQTIVTDQPTMCTLEYMPVCAAVQVQCFRAPCPPITQTFGNKCGMQANPSATYLYDGECKDPTITNTSWNIISFDDKIAIGASISFSGDHISANVCNIFNGEYKLNGDTFIVGPMMSTKMACMGDLARYESAFDLSGARFEISTDGETHLMITTLSGHKFQWSKEWPIKEFATGDKLMGIVNPASVYCTDNGGTLNIVDGKDGQYGMCTFSDGSKCEEWSYFKGECKPTTDKLQTVLTNYLSVVRFTEEGYKQFFVDLKSKINLGFATATGPFKTAYSQIVTFLKSY